MQPLRYIRTERLTVATVSAVFVNTATLPNLQTKVISVIGNVAFHVLITPGNQVAATTNSPYFSANDMFLIPVPAGAEISILGAAGGSVWVSEVVRS